MTSLRTIASPARPELGIPDSWVDHPIRRWPPHDTGTVEQARTCGPLAQEVATNVLREKRRLIQAKSYPTILIADLAGGDLPDIRYWNDAFDDLWRVDDEYLIAAAMTRLTTKRMPTLAFSLNPHADKDTVKNAAVILSPDLGVP